MVKTGTEAFSGEVIEEKKQLIASKKWQINIHLKRASKLPSADSNG